MSLPDIHRVKEFFLSLQDTICHSLENIDQKSTFQQDTWERKEGGGGRTRVLTNGALFEQAGVNFSHVYGDTLPKSATAHRPELAGRRFQQWGFH